MRTTASVPYKLAIATIFSAVNERMANNHVL